MEKGLAVSPGIGIGRAYIIREPDITIDKSIIRPEQVQAELDRLSAALVCSRDQLQAIYHSAVSRGEKEKSEILEAHIMMLEDPMLVEQASVKNRYCGFWKSHTGSLALYYGIILLPV